MALPQDPEELLRSCGKTETWSKAAIQSDAILLQTKTTTSKLRKSSPEMKPRSNPSRYRCFADDLDDPHQIPRDTDYASIFESDVPIVVQHTRLDSRHAEVALLSTVA
jgi:hypothetical protein